MKPEKILAPRTTTKMLLRRIAATRSIHTTRHAKDLRPLLKQMFADHQSKQKPMDLGTAFILGAPAVGCFGMYIWKQDTEILAPLREAKKLKAASSKND